MPVIPQTLFHSRPLGQSEPRSYLMGCCYWPSTRRPGSRSGAIGPPECSRRNRCDSYRQGRSWRWSWHRCTRPGRRARSAPGCSRPLLRGRGQRA